VQLIQYSLLGRTAASIRLNTTLYSNELTLLCAREDYIESCRRESFKAYSAAYVRAVLSRMAIDFGRMCNFY
jgi:hypothetical protein